MLCKNCGIELEDTAAVCPECGAQAEIEAEAACEKEVVSAAEEVAAEPSQEEAGEEPAAEEGTDAETEISAEEDVACADFTAEEDTQQDGSEYGFAPEYNAEEASAPAKKSNKILISIIAVVVMVALVVAGIFVVPKFFGENYEDVAKNYGFAQAEADLIEASKYCLCSYVEAYDKMVDYSCDEYGMTREEFFEILSEQYGETIADINQLFAAMKEDAVTYLQEEYGAYTISAKIVGSEEMSPEDITELKEYITEDQGYDYPSMFEGVDADKISAGYIVEVELTLSGTKSTDTESQEVTVVKYNGKWKAIGE